MAVVAIFREIFSSVLALACASVLLGTGIASAADGNYQRTKDGRTLVWNADPNPGDMAGWSGDRDKDGYAAGFGTLNWYSNRPNGSETKQTLYASYFGNMIRGKFHGPVNGHSKGLTNHALFIDGKRASRWAAGPAPSWRMPERKTEVPLPEEPQKGEENIAGEFYPPPPSYAVAIAGRRPTPNYGAIHSEPADSANIDVPAEGPNSSRKGEGVAPAGDANPPKLEIDSSLRSLVGSPPVLRSTLRSADRQKNQNDSIPDDQPLKTAYVIGLADAEAKKQGYDLNRYRRPAPQFDRIDGSWSLVYQPNGETDGTKVTKRFVVAIDDKTKRTALVAED